MYQIFKKCNMDIGYLIVQQNFTLYISNTFTPGFTDQA